MASSFTCCSSPSTRLFSPHCSSTKPMAKTHDHTWRWLTTQSWSTPRALSWWTVLSPQTPRSWLWTRLRSWHLAFSNIMCQIIHRSWHYSMISTRTLPTFHMRSWSSWQKSLGKLKMLIKRAMIPSPSESFQVLDVQLPKFQTTQRFLHEASLFAPGAKEPILNGSDRTQVVLSGGLFALD